MFALSLSSRPPSVHQSTALARLLAITIAFAPWLGNFNQLGAPGVLTCYSITCVTSLSGPTSYSLLPLYCCVLAPGCMCHTARWPSSSFWRMHPHQHGCWRSGGRCLKSKKRWSCRSRSLRARCAAVWQHLAGATREHCQSILYHHNQPVHALHAAVHHARLQGSYQQGTCSNWCG
jgi:hypothetical protein